MERILSTKPLVSSTRPPPNIQEQRRSSQKLSHQSTSLQENQRFNISSSLFLQRVREITSPPPPAEEDLLVPNEFALDLFGAVLSVETPAFLIAVFLDLYNGATAPDFPCSDDYIRKTKPEDVGEDSWNALYLNLKEWMKSANEELQEFCITLVSKLLRWGADGYFQLREFNESMCDIITRKLSNSNNVSSEVKETLVKVSPSYILHSLKHEYASISQDLLRAVMNRVFIDGEIKFDTDQERYAQVVILGLSEVPEVREALMNHLLLFVKDSDPNVRRKAIITVQGMCKKFNPEFQVQYHETVVPGLTANMSDFLNPQIQAEAVRAVLYYFTEECRSDIFTAHLDNVIASLHGCLLRGGSDMQELVLKAISSLASSALQGLMIKHYKRLMLRINMVMLCDVKIRKKRKLLAAMIECITTLWTNVGRNHIWDDTGRVLQLLGSLHELSLKPDNLRKAVLQAWGRICICLEEDFLTCTTVVVPHLLESAQLDPNMSIPEDPDNEESHESYEKRVSCKLMEEKAEACWVLGIVAYVLKEEFASWVPKVVDILVPLFDHTEPVRAAAITAVKPILESYKLAEEKGVGVYAWRRNLSYQELSSRVDRAICKANESHRNEQQ